ncbi:hypothetical protein BDV38DRAFT_272862 [Aspergillus pseudotamarii]|uniref:FAD/NAD(P)-binding domain-containing protein n=1 Tax=Aspergillus pseudotamarii TaxID=132259 RepID=A0A5N6SKW9_ASPPS|nr:uncharacterized protein BDV38DRAFT_272862 [Aspergillus pseudotamarii]KAE8135336.1 hypothetical protein BDV38DRAFT_272862 [Aspergillus pseudotamarii]
MEDEGASPRELVVEACRRDQPHLIEQVLKGMEGKSNEEVAEFFNGVTDSLGNHALHICATYGSGYTMDCLFDIQYFECDPLTRLDKDTPLHTAVRYANEKDRELGLEMIEMMCEAGCDPRVKNKHGQKPVDLVYNNSEIKSILQQTEYVLAEGLRDAPDNGSVHDSANDRSRNFRFLHGTVTQLDHTGRNVTVSFPANDTTDTIDFHALVIATGASTPSPLLGLNHDVGDLRENWIAFRKALSTAKSILISGGGPAGVETAGELGEYLNGRAWWFHSQLANPKVPITVVTSGPQILPLLRPSLASLAEQYLAQVGVTVIKSARVQNVAPTADSKDALTAKTTVTLEDGQALGADLYIPATGTRANAGFIDRSLLTPDGRVDTNPSTLRVDKAGPRVYAIGDVSSWARPTVHFIVEAIPVLCANMKRDLLHAAGEDEGSAGEDRLFKEDTRETQLVPIGKSKGVGAAMGYRLPSFLVWLMKGRDYWLWTTEKLWSGRQWSKEL